jgi:hypothetical protein
MLPCPANSAPGSSVVINSYPFLHCSAAAAAGKARRGRALNLKIDCQLCSQHCCLSNLRRSHSATAAVLLHCGCAASSSCSNGRDCSQMPSLRIGNRVIPCGCTAAVKLPHCCTQDCGLCCPGCWWCLHEQPRQITSSMQLHCCGSPAAAVSRAGSAAVLLRLLGGVCLLQLLWRATSR